MNTRYTILLLLFLIGSEIQIQAQEREAFIRSFQKSYQSTPERVDPYLPPSGRKTGPSRGLKDSLIFCIQVNVDENGNNIIGDAANEPSIAINPLNPNEIVVGWRQFDNVNSNFRQAGVAYSIDAGQSWINQEVLEPGVFRSDPVLDCDGNGVFYYNSLTVDITSNGGYRNFRCDVFRANTIGVWDKGTSAFGGDKQWMAIDQTPGTPPNIYSYWSNSFSICQGNFTRSIDGGDSYEDCLFTQVMNLRYGTMDVDKQGGLYIGGVDGEFYIIKSTNAPDKRIPLQWDFAKKVDLGGSFRSGGRTNPGGLNSQVEIAVDRSNGPTDGYVYMATSVLSGMGSAASTNVMFARSIDGANSWDPPIRINNNMSNENRPWMVTMSVAPNGRIDIIWLDTRDNFYYNLSALYYAYSEDGGVNWSENFCISDTFDSRIGWPNQNKMGDYFDMESDNGGAHLAWSATFNGEQDVYYSYIEPAKMVKHSNENSATNTTEDDLLIFPNPFLENFYLNSNSGDLMQVRVFNIYGQLLYERIFQRNHGISASTWNKGMYVVEIKNLNSEVVSIFKVLRI